MSEYTYDEHIASYKGNNRSRYIEELIVRGSQSLTEDIKDQKAKIIDLLKRNREKDEEIRILRSKLNKKTNGGAGHNMNCVKCNQYLQRKAKIFQNKKYCMECYIRESTKR